MPVKIDDKMEEILDLFQDKQRVTTGYLIEQTGYSRPTVTKRLDRLHSPGYIDYLHEPTALWELKQDPRDDEQ